MVPVQFIEDLAEELKLVLGHMNLKTPAEENTEINIFQYGLPKEKTKEDSKKKFPYVLILPQEGAIPDSSSEQKVKSQLLIGIYDNDNMNHGKKDVLNVINDICERFLKNPILKGQYYAEEEITWVLDTEDEHPYHYGAVSIVFNIPAFRRESKYA